MAKQIARLLKTDIMADLDMPALAQVLASKGRKGDTMLAHITPKEAALLKSKGGAGTTNPDTGLPEFYDGDFRLSDYADFSAPDVSTGGYRTKSDPIGDIASTATGRLYPQVDFSYMPPQQQAATSTGGFEEFPSGMSAAASLPRSITPTEQLYSTPEAAAAFQQYYAPGRDVSGGIVPAAASYAPALPEAPPSFLTRVGERLQQPETLEKLGLAGLQALPGILASRQAAAQGREAKAEMQRLAAPYQQQGQALLQQAQRGELTAPAQQQIQALQARAAQGVAARGGVGAEQAAAQVEAFRQQLLQNQYEMGLKVANIGDQIAAGAIRTGLSADQYVNQLTDTYFTNIARSMYGQAPQVPQTQVVRT